MAVLWLSDVSISVKDKTDSRLHSSLATNEADMGGINVRIADRRGSIKD